MRNATLNGVFLTASLEVADSDEMRNLEIFTKDNIRRMGDVEFASQLLGYERKGVLNETQTTMNELYDEFSDEYADADADKKKVKASLKMIAEVFKSADVSNFFETQNYVYTLHSLFDIMPKRASQDWIEPLSAFVAAYKGADLDDDADGDENGSAKLCLGSGGIVLLQAK